MTDTLPSEQDLTDAIIFAFMHMDRGETWPLPGPSIARVAAKAARELLVASAALSRPAPAQEWQPIETAPKDGRFYLYGLHVRNMSGHRWFESFYLALDDDGELQETCGDTFSTWHYDDFEVWADAPQPLP